MLIQVLEKPKRQTNIMVSLVGDGASRVENELAVRFQLGSGERRLLAILAWDCVEAIVVEFGNFVSRHEISFRRSKANSALVEIVSGLRLNRGGNEIMVPVMICDLRRVHCIDRTRIFTEIQQAVRTALQLAR